MRSRISPRLSDYLLVHGIPYPQEDYSGMLSFRHWPKGGWRPFFKWDRKVEWGVFKKKSKVVIETQLFSWWELLTNMPGVQSLKALLLFVNQQCRFLPPLHRHRSCVLIPYGKGFVSMWNWICTSVKCDFFNYETGFVPLSNGISSRVKWNFSNVKWDLFWFEIGFFSDVKLDLVHCEIGFVLMWNWISFKMKLDFFLNLIVW